MSWPHLTNGTVLVWDLATEQEQPPITLEAGPIKRDEFPVAAFTSDRRHLVTGRRTGPVELWDLQSGKRLQTFAGHTGEVRSVACSADGRLILSAGSDNTVRLWDVASGKELKQLKSDDRPVRCVAFSPDGRRALSAGVYGLVHLWDLASGKEVCRMEGHTMAVNSVAFSPDGRRAVSGSDDGPCVSGNCRNRGVPTAGGVERFHSVSLCDVLLPLREIWSRRRGLRLGRVTCVAAPTGNYAGARENGDS